jgi:hypothetical protein
MPPSAVLHEGPGARRADAAIRTSTHESGVTVAHPGVVAVAVRELDQLAQVTQLLPDALFGEQEP